MFVDLQKAFDTVNHSILLKKMERYGARGVFRQWFASYLSSGEQVVSVNGHNSSRKMSRVVFPKYQFLVLYYA